MTGTTTAPALADDGTAKVGTILAAKAYPGIQLIATTYTADVSVPVPQVNQSALNDLVQRLILQAASGVIGTSDAAIAEAIVDEIVKAPNSFFTPSGQTYSQSATITGVGTGWVISDDGYLVTAAHVVSADPAELQPEFAATALTKISRQFIKGLSRGNTTFTRGQLQRLNEAVTGWFAQRITVSNLNSSVSALISRGTEVQGKKQDVVDAEVIDQGVPYPGNDVAVLKIDGVKNLPTMTLGSNDDVEQGSTLHVVGFPAASTFSPGFSGDSQAQPTVTEGPVTAVKSTDDGMPVFQTQAPASPGNSGGPVLNDDGKVVGVLVAAAVGSDGVALEGQEFVIPVSVVNEMLDKNGVKAQVSDTSKDYNEALDDFYVKHYKAALPLFKKVAKAYPNHPYVQGFIDDTNAAIANGEDKTPAAKKASSGGLGKTALIGAGALLGLLLLGGLGFLFMRKSKSKAPATGGSGPATPGWSGSQPQAPYQPPQATAPMQTAPYPAPPVAQPPVAQPPVAQPPVAQPPAAPQYAPPAPAEYQPPAAPPAPPQYAPPAPTEYQPPAAPPAPPQYAPPAPAEYQPPAAPPAPPQYAPPAPAEYQPPPPAAPEYQAPPPPAAPEYQAPPPPAAPEYQAPPPPAAPEYQAPPPPATPEAVPPVEGEQPPGN